jgi:hypothetical protein
LVEFSGREWSPFVDGVSTGVSWSRRSRLGGYDGVGVGGPVAVVAISHSRFQAGAQGQEAGRCRSRRRLVVAIRAGTSMIRRRRVAQRALSMPAAVAAAPARLNAITAKETQAALAAYLPESSALSRGHCYCTRPQEPMTVGASAQLLVPRCGPSASAAREQ